MNIENLYKHFLECTEVTTDTRKCVAGSMFFALKGETFNGNKFAAKAIEEGCKYAVIDEPEYQTDKTILVDDCLKALQQLANYHRQTLKTPIIGVTGTNGKTTTKELMAAVLTRKYNLLYTQGNLNNHIGVPLTLLRLTKEHQFGSFEGVIRTKGELYDYLRSKGNATIFIQNENTYLNNIAGNLNCVRYGQTPGLFVSGEMVDCSPFLKFRWTAEGTSHDVQTSLIGAYNLDNVLAAVAIGRYFKVEDKDICDAIASYVPTNNRSMLKKTDDNTLIVDAYNANPTSMMEALKNFQHIDAPHKMAILGDMKELGEASKEEHQKIADYLSNCGLERIILVGSEFKSTNHPGTVLDNVEQVKAELQNHKPQGFYILVKGSNSTKLYQLPDYL